MIRTRRGLVDGDGGLKTAMKITADTITDEQIRELGKYARHVADITLASKCAGALHRTRSNRTSNDLLREHCAIAYNRATETREWGARDLPFGAFEVAEQIAQFVTETAAEWGHIEQVHDALIDIALRIRTADWTPEARARCVEIVKARP